MIAKFGFILLTLLFGALMFVAGILSPDDWQHNVKHWSASMMASFDSPKTDIKPKPQSAQPSNQPAGNPVVLPVSAPASVSAAVPASH